MPKNTNSMGLGVSKKGMVGLLKDMGAHKPSPPLGKLQSVG